MRAGENVPGGEDDTGTEKGAFALADCDSPAVAQGCAHQRDDAGRTQRVATLAPPTGAISKQINPGNTVRRKLVFDGSPCNGKCLPPRRATGRSSARKQWADQLPTWATIAKLPLTPQSAVALAFCPTTFGTVSVFAVPAGMVTGAARVIW